MSTTDNNPTRPNPLRSLQRFDAAMARLPQPAVFIILLAMIAGLGLLDHLSGSEISLTIFYLIPVSFAAWFLGQRWGVVVAFACASIGMLGDITTTQYSNQFIYAWNGLVRLVYFLSFSYVTWLLTALHSALLSESELARRDPLTGIANRRRFFEVGEEALEECRESGRPLSVAFIDLDEFKEINDRFGHETGDEAIRQFARLITAALPAGLTPARLGGDEFAVLMPGYEKEAAEETVVGLRGSLDGYLVAGATPLTVSIGLTTFGHPPANIDIIMNEADKLMYRAKGEGKGEQRFRRVE